ncbi:outer membrane beta-barrel domain-containing protein, partial [Rheinheimera baltica]
METWLQRIFLVLSFTSVAAMAQQVEPDIERQVVSEDLLDSENWLLGARVGVISIEDFGSSAVSALQLTYHINEDFYLSAEYAMAKAGKTSFEELSGAAPLLTDSEREWRYYGGHLGYMLLPGETF